MRSVVVLAVLFMAACQRQEVRSPRALVRPPTTHGVVGLQYEVGADRDSGFERFEAEVLAVSDAGVDFLWVDLRPHAEAGGAREVFSMLARSRSRLRVAVSIESPTDAGVDAEQASLQEQADEVWSAYANSARFADAYQHLHGRPLLLVSVPVIANSCAAGCESNRAWNDRAQGRFTIRFVSSFLNRESEIADAYGRARGWWSRREEGLPVWSYQDSIALPEHVGISLEGVLDQQWRRALDVDPAVVTLHGWARERRTTSNLEALSNGAAFARRRRSHTVLRDTTTGVWYFRSAPGFTVETTISWVSGAHYEPLLCDFDGDGVQDLGLRDSSLSGQGRWHFKRGPKFDFQTEWSFAWTTTSGPDYRALAGDFDGDGFCEIGVRHTPSGVVSWRRPIPDSKEHSLSWTAGAQFEPFVGDFDGDRQTDVALAESHGDVHVRFGPDYIREGALRAPAFAPVIFSGDFDGDGRSELASYDFRDHGWGLGRFAIEWRDGGVETFSWASGANYQVLAGDIR